MHICIYLTKYIFIKERPIYELKPIMCVFFLYDFTVIIYEIKKKIINIINEYLKYKFFYFFFQ